jgi:hypothetical protein
MGRGEYGIDNPLGTPSDNQGLWLAAAIEKEAVALSNTRLLRAISSILFKRNINFKLKPDKP